MKLFRRSKARIVEFCERCGRVCDGACRAGAIRERNLESVLRLGPRF